MPNFGPIAIVGQGCVLPGAHDPETFWNHVSQGRDLISTVDPNRWGIRRDRVVGTPEDSTDKTWSDRGGYVTDFVFDPSGFEVPVEQLTGLDPLNHWLLTSGRAAMQGVKGDRSRAGVVIGNLSFPSGAMARFAESVWVPERDTESVAPANRFMSGRPAHLLAEALGFGAGGFALDAACASSLYAIKLAADRLNDGEVDVMLAGAVNRADDLFIHVGFCALSALSKTGRSRPFHAEADGLVPAEGCVLFALKRLSDAELDGDEILGVIRGVGLSNDGRGRGFLAPATAGQVVAMRSAYQQAGWSPKSVGLVECHATGTPVGDAAELSSLATVFEGASDVPLGSLKSNLGHLITAAGGAALIKVLGAMAAHVRPPTLHAQTPSPALAAPFRLVHKPEPWLADGPRRAAVSAFGFGGNNAHLLVEEYAPRGAEIDIASVAIGAIAVVGLGCRVGNTVSRAGFARALFGFDAVGTTTEVVSLALTGLRFPPRDLQQSLPQQLTALATAREAVGDRSLPQSTGVLMGMGADPEVCRYGARWRMGEWYADQSDVFVAQAREGVVPRLESAGVLGNMPNIPANRINSQFDVRGPSFTVSSEELSGIAALRVAMRQLRSGELDAALVGATDMSVEPVHMAAAKAVLCADRHVPGDAAVCLVLKRLDDARADGDDVLAVIDDDVAAELEFGDAPGAVWLGDRFGHAHAASGLVHVAAAVLAVHHRALPSETPTGWDSARRTVRVDVAAGTHRSPIVVREFKGGPAPSVATLREHLSGEPEMQGPKLTVPTHRDAVKVPVRPGTLPLLADGAQWMSPAPPLVPITGGSLEETTTAPPTRNSPPVPPIRRSSQPETVQQPAITAFEPSVSPMKAPVQSSDPVVPLAPAYPALGALAATHAHLVSAHQAFVTDQAAVHQQFLELRQRMAAMLANTGMTGAQPSTRSAPVMPTSPPIPAPRSVPAAAPPVAPAPVVARAPAPPTAVNEPPPTPAPTVEASDDGGPRVTYRSTFVRDLPADAYPGPTLGRDDLMVHASGSISTIFGDEFGKQDGYHRQVRMPEPPLLLADRCLGIDAPAGVLGTGTIWTETDVCADSWYLHNRRMPAGVMIESGQADLMLISWMGIDFLNKSERVYRLLGCDLTYHGSLPKAGETLRYDIHMDGHANQGDVRLMFFHYDCYVDDGHGNRSRRLSVRQGQAGFFTAEELDDSAGILWTPETGEHDASARLDEPAVLCARDAFSDAQLESFANGDLVTCFGEGFEASKAHSATPTIQSGEMQFLHRIESFDPRGGPWGRGYLRAAWDVTPDDWFFEGHFHNDPCMPGTMMFEGCLQAMSFYMAALGYTLPRDGWRFQPVQDHTIPLRCRGQVLPRAGRLTYEIFVEEVHNGPVPTLYADLLCTIDGLKAFHARRMGLQLVPDWPYDTAHPLPEDYVDPEPVAIADGHAFGFRAMLNCAQARPSSAFGPMYKPFDSPTRVARLPGPPYHFMTRATRLVGEPAVMKAGAEVDMAYDIPSDAWYFDENGHRTMPYAVLLEAALQPCGWLASYVGCALTTDQELFFRNLDGTSTLHRDIVPEDGTLVTTSKLTGISKSGPMIIVSFEVVCRIGDEIVYDMDTVFGFFPHEALANQKGLAATPDEKAGLQAPANRDLDLSLRPARFFEVGPRIAGGDKMLMVDRLSVCLPDGGPKGLGRFRGEKDIDAGQWFFKAHFFQDPVQPGSLGIEALIQVLQAGMIEKGLADGFKHPRFEPIGLHQAMTWKYRGQVRTWNKLVLSLVDITEITVDDNGVLAVADGVLFVDGMKIYTTTGMGMRIVEGDADGESDREVSVRTAPWLADHCPTFTLPAMPLMGMVDRLVGAAERHVGGPIPGFTQVNVHRWLVVDPPAFIRTEVTDDADGLRVILKVRSDKGYNTVASAVVADEAPGVVALSALENPGEAFDPYATDALFHGPAYQLAKQVTRGTNGADAVLDATIGAVPKMTVHPALLDAATHAIPHDQLQLWTDLGPDVVSYPHRIDNLVFNGPVPEGQVTAQVRFDGLDGPRHPAFLIQIVDDDPKAGPRVWASMRLVEIAMPKGPIGSADPGPRKRFLQGDANTGVTLARVSGDQTIVDLANVSSSNWLPGTLETVYGTKNALEIARKEHVGRLAGVHPKRVVLGLYDRVRTQPVTRYALDTDVACGEWGEAVFVRGGPELDLTKVRSYWARHFDVGRWPVEDLYYGLIERFVEGVVLDDPDAFDAIKGRGALFLGNHQVGIESLLLSMVAGALIGSPTAIIAKAEHTETWLGRLIQHCFSYPGVVDPQVMVFFDRTKQEELANILGTLGPQLLNGDKSLMVHVDGTRALSCREPVLKLSSIFIDLAVKFDIPIVPVWLSGGLPVEPVDERLELPVGMGKQTYHFGRPILGHELGELPLKQRKQAVIDAINDLAPAEEVPSTPDLVFAEKVTSYAEQTGLDAVHAALFQTLAERTELGDEARSLVTGDGPLILPDTPHGQWLAELARRLFGPNGRKVKVG